AGLGAGLLAAVDRAEHDDLGAVEVRRDGDVARRDVRLHRLLGARLLLTPDLLLAAARRLLGDEWGRLALLRPRLACARRQEARNQHRQEGQKCAMAIEPAHQIASGVPTG